MVVGIFRAVTELTVPRGFPVFGVWSYATLHQQSGVSFRVWKRVLLHS
jgi:hypothetical protein